MGESLRKGLGVGLIGAVILIAAAVVLKAALGEAPMKLEEHMSAYMLLQEYEENEVAAERRLRGRCIAVDGRIWHIGTSHGEPYVVLEGPGLSGVFCDMDEDMMDEAARLKTGQLVSVAGRVGTRKRGFVPLRDCRLLESHEDDRARPESRTEP